MKGKEISRIVLAVIFGLFIVIVVVVDAVTDTFPKIISSSTFSDASSRIVTAEPLKSILLEVNGFFSDYVDLKGYYNDIGLYITEDRYIMSPAAETSTDYEVGQTLALKQYLDEKGINLIYVNQPTKYIDDNVFVENFGVLSYSNRNADKFLRRISEAGVNTVDLRDDIKNEGLDIKNMFYYTDHHWTTETGFWAAKKIVESLNRYAGYNADLSVYDRDKYVFRSWEHCWIGEQGAKVFSRRLIKDSFTNIAPAFDTSFYFKSYETDGDFSMFYDEAIYELTGYFALGASWHYSYQLNNVINNKVDNGKILMVCDSYAYVCEPFVALSVHSVDNVILRGTDINLRDMIEEGDYDTVPICYAQFMIGAHDDPESANYRMFKFD